MAKRVLIVDDSRTTLQVVQVHLMGFGYEFDVASGGHEALSRIDRQTPDLVISDLEMPGMSGLDLCQKLRSQARFRRLPFVIVTSHKDGASRRAAFAAGVDGFLTKPIDPSHLSSLVGRLLSP